MNSAHRYSFRKFDDTVQYLHNDKVDGWVPQDERFQVTVNRDSVNVDCTESGKLTFDLKLSVQSDNDETLVATDFCDVMGQWTLTLNRNENVATLVLQAPTYIVGRYLKSEE